MRQGCERKICTLDRYIATFMEITGFSDDESRYCDSSSDREPHPSGEALDFESDWHSSDSDAGFESPTCIGLISKTYSVLMLHPHLPSGRWRLDFDAVFGGDMGSIVGVACDANYMGCRRCRPGRTCTCSDGGGLTFAGFDIGYTIEGRDSHLCHIQIDDWEPAGNRSYMHLDGKYFEDRNFNISPTRSVQP